MADELAGGAPAAPESPAAIPAPVGAAPEGLPSASPAQPVSQSPAVEAKLDTGAPPGEPTPAAGEPEKPEPVSPGKSLLAEAREEADKKAPGAKTEAKPEAKPEGKAEAKAEGVFEPVNWDEAYKLPDNFKLEDADRKVVNAMFEKAGVKAAEAQTLVDYHIQRMEALAKQNADFNQNFWNETRRGWRNEVAKDPEIGGSGLKTRLVTSLRVINTFVSEKHREDFDRMGEMTGIFDHPEFIRFTSNIARFLDESPPAPSNPQAPKDIGKAPGRGRLHYSSMGDGR